MSTAKPFVRRTGALAVLRAEAIASGATRYAIGFACRWGHISGRNTANGWCFDCEKEYRARRVEKERAYHSQYSKDYYRKNKGRRSTKKRTPVDAASALNAIKATAKAYRDGNDRLQTVKRRYNEKNKAKLNQCKAAWRIANKDYMRVAAGNRRALERRAPGKHTKADLQRLYQLQRGKCVACLADLGNGYHADHVIALVSGGSNDWTNLQLLCASCNHQKHARHHIDFMQRKGFLL